MPSLGPASLTQVYQPEETVTKVEHSIEPIPRTYVAAKIARINSKSQKKNNSPIVLRKPSMNQKTKRPYNHTEKRKSDSNFRNRILKLNMKFRSNNAAIKLGRVQTAKCHFPSGKWCCVYEYKHTVKCTN